MNSGKTDYTGQLWFKTKVTSEQRRVAKSLGVNLVAGDSFLVAAARITEAVAEAVGETPRHEPSKKQKELSSKINLDISADSHRIAWAKIQERTQRLYYEANMAAIQEMQLVPGDTVMKSLQINIPAKLTQVLSAEYIVSSIRWDGLVYFKGGNGGCSWAKELTKTGNKK